MKMIKRVCLLLIGILIVSSCTVEKRLYNKGFHVEWNKRLKSSDGEQQERNTQFNANADKLLDDPGTVRQSAADWNDESSVLPSKAYKDETPNFVADILTIREEDRADGYNESYLDQKLDVKKTNVRPIKVSLKQRRKPTLKSANEPTVGTSQIVALLLVLLVGVLGIHRFYLGYYGIGVLMILTLGCCGLLALIDLIRIAIGDLKPKYGEYTETLSDL